MNIECRLVNLGRAAMAIEYRRSDMEGTRTIGKYTTITQAVRDIGYQFQSKPVGYLTPVNPTSAHGWVTLNKIR